MNASAVGLALSGKKPIVIHERFDFAVVGMQGLLQANAWKSLGIKLPLIVVVIVGHGKGQGNEQRGDYRGWFMGLDGWNYHLFFEREANYNVKDIFRFTDKPNMIIIPRQLYD